MCSIIGVGERLHKVLGQTGKRPHLTFVHWTQVSDRCPLSYLFLLSTRGDGLEPVRKLKSLEWVKTEIYWYSMRLRHQRRFDDANNLEKLFDSLTEHIGMSKPVG